MPLLSKEIKGWPWRKKLAITRTLKQVGQLVLFLSFSLVPNLAVSETLVEETKPRLSFGLEKPTLFRTVPKSHKVQTDDIERFVSYWSKQLPAGPFEYDLFVAIYETIDIIGSSERVIYLEGTFFPLYASVPDDVLEIGMSSRIVKDACQTEILMSAVKDGYQIWATFRSQDGIRSISTHIGNLEC